MADSKTCKHKRKSNWTQALLLLAQLVNENKDITKGKFVFNTEKNDSLNLLHFFKVSGRNQFILATFK